MTARIAIISLSLFAGVLVCIAACSSTTPSAGGGVDGGDAGSDRNCVLPTTGEGCMMDDTLACSGGAVSFACPSGDNPALADTLLTCSIPAACADPCGCEDPYCCFPTPAGFSSATCVPDYALTSVCPRGRSSYGYQCVRGDDPSTIDSSLTCSSRTPDPDGVHDDFCCTYN